MIRLAFGLITVFFVLGCSTVSENKTPKNKSLPMPFHVTMEVTVEDFVMDGDILNSLILVHQTESKPQGQQIFLDRKQARAFIEYLPLTKGERFTVRESIITNYDGSTFATYNVLEKLSN